MGKMVDGRLPFGARFGTLHSIAMAELHSKEDFERLFDGVPIHRVFEILDRWTSRKLPVLAEEAQYRWRAPEELPTMDHLVDVNKKVSP